MIYSSNLLFRGFDRLFAGLAAVGEEVSLGVGATLLIHRVPAFVASDSRACRGAEGNHAFAPESEAGVSAKISPLAHRSVALVALTESALLDSRNCL